MPYFLAAYLLVLGIIFDIILIRNTVSLRRPGTFVLLEYIIFLGGGLLWNIGIGNLPSSGNVFAHPVLSVMTLVYVISVVGVPYVVVYLGWETG